MSEGDLTDDDDDEEFSIRVVEVVAMVFFFFDLRDRKALELLGGDALKEK